MLMTAISKAQSELLSAQLEIETLKINVSNTVKALAVIMNGLNNSAEIQSEVLSRLKSYHDENH
jgi:hypothetical protein